MEFTVACDVRSADLARIGNSLREADPAAMVDAGGDGLRVAGAFDVDTLLQALRRAGCAVDVPDIARVPSVCCGGCSG
ncbi:hypothetical protein [Lysobacter arvi]|uniref:Copper chaperone n=1 Tax=Lysobacter arvi TaxID=3038776 RepID=A0ABU1CDX7_9GAMM|nr:hypothetical protein [Lysobacter arvi]MDR0183393.1 hypothetical protein [Lysobacter arvi]